MLLQHGLPMLLYQFFYRQHGVHLYQCRTHRNIGRKGRPAEPEELPFSAPAQRQDIARPAAPQQHQAEQQEPRANREGTETQMSDVSETAQQGGQDGEQASAPRRRTGHEEITDLAYEAADHTQDFAEEIEDAVRPFKLPTRKAEMDCACVASASMFKLYVVMTPALRQMFARMSFNL